MFENPAEFKLITEESILNYTRNQTKTIFCIVYYNNNAIYFKELLKVFKFQYIFCKTIITYVDYSIFISQDPYAIRQLLKP